MGLYFAKMQMIVEEVTYNVPLNDLSSPQLHDVLENDGGALCAQHLWVLI